MNTIIEVRDLTKDFDAGRGRVLRALDKVSFGIGKGQTLGLVGESGSGKSTTGRVLIGLIPPTSGTVTQFGETLGSRGPAPAIRRRMQFVFQDPNGALDPRMRVGYSIAEPLAISGEPRRVRTERVAELLEMVGLPRDAGERYPHEFSGGQRQRIGIARALALQPEFIICDEPVSALDVSLQAQVINLLLDLQERLSLTYLFIAHDLAVVRSISTHVAVMYAGRIVELAPRRMLYDSPRHPYTRALLAAVPWPDPERKRGPALRGEIPSVLDPPAGCAFAARCPLVQSRCRSEQPLLRELAPGHQTACHLA